ncbi:hypothetical protein KFK09_013618 [Dendrobium nobile]|uniref:Uncharacterized protein n=1 Tax=Dendrobium nobile TaxID=94219 RepID=A0A8T3B7V3_DENNO|nr:hypothetical protein KFK09_013618 [Dendrobium nobile]
MAHFDWSPNDVLNPKSSNRGCIFISQSTSLFQELYIKDYLQIFVSRKGCQDFLGRKEAFLSFLDEREE